MTDLLQRMNDSVDKANLAADTTFKILTGAVDTPVFVGNKAVDSLATRVRDYLDSALAGGSLDGADGIGIEQIYIDQGDLFVHLSGQVDPTNLGPIVPDDGVGVASSSVDPNTGELTIELTDGTVFNLGDVVGANGEDITDAYIESGNLKLQLASGQILDAGDITQFGGISANGADITEAGDLVVLFSDGTVETVGPVVGAKGKDGISTITGYIDTNGYLHFLRNDSTTYTIGQVNTTILDNSSVSVDGARLDASGNLILELTSGDFTVGKVTGADGLDGADGVGVESVFLDETDGNVYVTLTGGAPTAVGKAQVTVLESADVLVTNASIDANGDLWLDIDVNGSITNTNVGKVVGTDGVDGTIFTGARIEAGDLILTKEDTTELNAGAVSQVSVTDATINASGELVLTTSDGLTFNSGKITGLDGVDGTGISGAYLSGGDLHFTFDDPLIADVNVGNVLAPVETSASLSVDGDLSITLSDGQVFAVGNVRGGDGTYMTAANIVNGQLLIDLSDGQTGVLVGNIEKDPIAASITATGTLKVDFSDATSLETTARVQARDGDTITNIAFDPTGFDLVIDVTTDNGNTNSQVVIPAVQGDSITNVTADNFNKRLKVETTIHADPLVIDVPKGKDGDSVTSVGYNGSDLVIETNVSGQSPVSIPAVRGDTIEDAYIDANGHIVFEVSGQVDPLVFETIKGVDATESITDIYLNGTDLVIVKPDETLTIPAVKGVDGNTITNLSYDGTDLLIDMSNEPSVSVPVVKGNDGADGATIASGTINEFDELVLTMSDAGGTTYTIPGVGAAVSGAEIVADTGQLKLTLTDGTTLTTADSILGRDGNGTGVVDVVFTDGALTVTLEDAAANQTTIDAGNVSMVSVTGANIDATGVLSLTMSDSSVITVGNVLGEDGRFIQSVTIDANDHLILNMNVGDPIDAGNVRGDQGRSVSSIDVLVNGDLVFYYDDTTSELVGNVGDGAGLTIWDANDAPYSKDRVVIHDGGMYISLIDSNNDQPPSANWNALAFGDQLVEVRAPRLLSPISGNSGLSTKPVLKGSKYAPIVSGDARLHREFQVDLDTGDFSAPVYTKTVDSDTHELEVALSASTTHKWRCRDVSDRNYTSLWSPIETFVTPAGDVDMPVVSIASGESLTATFAAPEFTTSAFSTSSGEAHAETDWQVERVSDSVVVFESLNDTVNLTSAVVTFGSLDPSTQYRIRARHRGTTVESAWSDWVEFTTEDTFTYVETPAITYNGDTTQVPLNDAEFIGSDFSKTERFRLISDTIAMNHISTEWELVDVATGTVLESPTVLGTSTSRIIQTTLTNGNNYRIRVRYNSDRFGPSDWAAYLEFTASQYIDAPTVSTLEDVNNFPSGGTISSSAFSGVNETHVSTDWEIRDFNTDEVLWSSYTDTVDLVSKIVEWFAGDPLDNNDIKVRTRYNGNDVSSPWSAYLSLHTAIGEALFTYTVDSTGVMKKLDGLGVEVWSVTAPAAGVDLAIDFDGNIYVGCDNDRMYKYDTTGAQLWEHYTGDANNNVRDVAVENSGHSYVVGGYSSTYDFVHKLDSAGTKVWESNITAAINGSVAADASGFVYVGSYDHNVYKFDTSKASNSVEEWKFYTGNTDAVSLVVDRNGYVYAGKESGHRIFKIDPTGAQVWSFDDTSNTGINTTGIALTDDGYIYSCAGAIIKKIDPTGTEVWAFTGHTDTVNKVSVDKDGNVYSVSNDLTVRKIDPTGTEVWSFTGHAASVVGVDVSPGKFNVSQGL